MFKTVGTIYINCLNILRGPTLWATSGRLAHVLNVQIMSLTHIIIIGFKLIQIVHSLISLEILFN